MISAQWASTATEQRRKLTKQAIEQKSEVAALACCFAGTWQITYTVRLVFSAVSGSIVEELESEIPTESAELNQKQLRQKIEVQIQPQA